LPDERSYRKSEALLHMDGYATTQGLRTATGQVARNNLAEIQQGIEYFNALARSPDAIRFEIKIVDIGVPFALVPTYAAQRRGGANG
jgi:hypothetical protein